MPESTREWQSLSIEATTVGERGDVAVLALRGIIDTVSAEHLRDALAQVISGGRNKIVADMSHVEYVSSGGWGAFTERLREVRRAGGDIKLFGMDPDVYYVFTMLGFNIVLSSFDIFADAVDDFRRAAPGTEMPGQIAPPPRVDTPTDAARAAWSKAATPGLDLTWEDGGDGIRVARLTGVVETTAVSLIADELGREIERSPRGFLFDLTKVEYISSSGWGQFARAFEATHAVAIVGMGPDLLEVYDCLEFRNFIPAFATEGEGMRALAATTPGTAIAGTTSAPPARTPDAPSLSPSPDAHAEGLDDVLASPPSAGESARTAPELSRDAPNEKPIWGQRDKRDFNDAPASSNVDVDSAVSDRNKDRDKKLRSMGWEQYGQRLRGTDGDAAEGTPGDDSESGED